MRSTYIVHEVCHHQGPRWTVDQHGLFQPETFDEQFIYNAEKSWFWRRANHAINPKVDALERNVSARLMDTYQQRAFTILTSDATRQAFDLATEPPSLRDAYGRNIYGQSVLLARRLIEAGTRMVTLKWAPDANATWDTHGANFVKLKRELLPQLDAGLSTLLSDLDARATRPADHVLQSARRPARHRIARSTGAADPPDGTGARHPGIDLLIGKGQFGDSLAARGHGVRTL